METASPQETQNMDDYPPGLQKRPKMTIPDYQTMSPEAQIETTRKCHNIRLSPQTHIHPPLQPGRR